MAREKLQRLRAAKAARAAAVAAAHVGGERMDVADQQGQDQQGRGQSRGQGKQGHLAQGHSLDELAEAEAAGWQDGEDEGQALAALLPPCTLAPDEEGDDDETAGGRYSFYDEEGQRLPQGIRCVVLTREEEEEMARRADALAANPDDSVCGGVRAALSGQQLGRA